jgi:hypothetical protein
VLCALLSCLSATVVPCTGFRDGVRCRTLNKLRCVAASNLLHKTSFGFLLRALGQHLRHGALWAQHPSDRQLHGHMHWHGRAASTRVPCFLVSLDVTLHAVKTADSQPGWQRHLADAKGTSTQLPCCTLLLQTNWQPRMQAGSLSERGAALCNSVAAAICQPRGARLFWPEAGAQTTAAAPSLTDLWPLHATALLAHAYVCCNQLLFIVLVHSNASAC